MEPRGIHHVGVAVANLDGAVSTYERLYGAALEHRDTLPDQGVEAAAMRLGDGRVELLAALGDDTPVGRFLAKRGPGMHHVAFETDDLPGALDDVAAAGGQLIDSEPREGLYGMQVAFVHPDSTQGVLVELVSRG
jgi:methylmalonyl-CoA epimerase